VNPLPGLLITTVDELVRQMSYPHDLATFPVVGVTSLRHLVITVVITLFVLSLKGIVRPFELGGVTSLIQSVIIKREARQVC
jgi:hypothetical protein